MNQTIFLQAFLARLLPMYHEVVLTAIRHFQPAQYPAAAVPAALGALLASAVLYGIGIWLRRLPARVSTESQHERIAHLRAAAGNWLPWLLILAPTPVGGMLIIAAGFFAVRPWVVAAMLVAAEAAWRASPVL